MPEIGTWSIKQWSDLYEQSEVGSNWVRNCSQCCSPLEFEVENNSLYLVSVYMYEMKLEKTHVKRAWLVNGPPPDVGKFPGSPESYKLFVGNHSRVY